MSGNYQMTLDDVLEAQRMLVAMGQPEVDDKHFHVVYADGSTSTMYRDGCGFYLEDQAEYQPGPAIFNTVSMNFGRDQHLYVSPAVALAYEGLRWMGDPTFYMHLHPRRSAEKVVLL